ncbi:MAG TPA: hypothetical protein VL981_03475 [Candidatus Methylacidiphilales bacterium]|nr:hypothetical protein [Candidatus Methylacidiphilales bacterium]
MKNSLPWIAFGLILAWMIPADADPSPASHDASFSKEGLFKADVSKLKDTELVAHPDTPLDDGKNVLWCGTLQLAWNEAIKLAGAKLHFVQQPPVVDLLNQEDFTENDLDPGSYVAVADFERNNVEDEIRAALEKTFQGAASPELIPPKPSHPGPFDFVAYAYLYKDLAFAHPFATNDPMAFGTTQVKNFGFGKDLDLLPDGVMEQVSIYDYRSQDDFIIKLKPKTEGDELILAKLPPGATLQETINSVLERIAGHQPEPIGPGPRLAIPKLNFDLRRHFPELEGLTLKPGPVMKVKNLVITSVQQLVRFQLNEKGAILKSEAAMMVAGAAMPIAERHIMIFDKPFLILMKRTNSDRPYFALWVGNATLLVPASGT